MTTTEPIEIGFHHIAAICERLGLDPTDVARLTLYPNLATATVYLRNEQGTKYTTENKEPATEELRFKISTPETITR